MFWKYHIESGDLVEVTHNGQRGWGTVRGIIYPDGIDPEDELTVDEINLDDFSLLVQSGNEEVEVPMDQVHSRTAEEDRETDLPLLSEDLRLTGGLGQSV